MKRLDDKILEKVVGGSGVGYDTSTNVLKIYKNGYNDTFDGMLNWAKKCIREWGFSLDAADESKLQTYVQALVSSTYNMILIDTTVGENGYLHLGTYKFSNE